LTDGRVETLGRALVAHLRGVLAAPALDLAEPPVALTGGFDTEIYAVRLREAGAGGAVQALARLAEGLSEAGAAAPAQVERALAAAEAVR